MKRDPSSLGRDTPLVRKGAYGNLPFNFALALTGLPYPTWDAGMDRSRIVCQAENGDYADTAFNGAKITNALWHYVAGTFDRGAGNDNVRLYLDGVLNCASSV